LPVTSGSLDALRIASASFVIAGEQVGEFEEAHNDCTDNYRSLRNSTQKL
jgi:hypothetical protein